MGFLIPDNRPTMSEWPVRVWSEEEFPVPYREQALKWCGGEFSARDFVYAPKRRTSRTSFDYLFGYGKDRVLFLRAGEDGLRSVELDRRKITEVVTRRELLEASIILRYQADGEMGELGLPYVPSVYYLYDPFLNWVLGLDKGFSPAAAERKAPRPDKLYRQSLSMFNYSLSAYRLGGGFSEYEYASAVRRSKWMPWKKTLEEWLTVPMERGTFEVHHLRYLTQCVYRVERTETA